MRYLSLCSGIEAATVAWEPLGWTPVAFAEIDPFASAVLAHYWPRVPNLGDLAEISAAQLRALGPIDLVVGGTPCQDLSVAGLRKGLDGTRSGLFFDFVRLFDAARSICGARFALWENVPGALACNAGRDFGLVVSSLAGIERCVAPVDGWQSEGMALGPRGLVEWCCLDAQWFGLAQRRERLFALVDSGNWSDRPPILLEPESVRGDLAPRRSPRPDPSAASSSDPRARRLEGLIPEVADPIVVNEPRTYSHEGANNFRLRNIVACFDETQVTHPENRSTCGPETAALAKTARPPTIAIDDDGDVELRRLTVTECDRLMGFPDGFTKISFRGKPASDSVRYAALGNTIPTTLLRYIGERLAALA